MSQGLSVVGKRLPRPDAVEKATGTAKYTADIKLPGMLIGKVLRSPYPHARILRIDKSKAERLPGVEAVITLEDVPRIRFLGSYYDLPLSSRGPTPELADQYVFTDKARYIGDPVAAVAAISENMAEEALQLIDVKYEQLPAVFDPIETMKPSAPRVHDSVENNIPVHLASPVSQGDVEKAFQDADCIVEDSFYTTRQVHCQMEPATAIASFDPSGRLTIWSQCQMPYLGRRALAHILDMPVGMVRFINPHVGGSFGGRNGLGPELMCAALAKKAGRPVKLEYTKEEDFRVSNTKTALIYNEKLGLKKDGTLIAIQVNAVTDGVAYLHRASGPLAIFLNFSLEGAYRCPNKLGEGDVVYANLPPSGACRGMGNPDAMWGIEQLMDRAAERLGMDPLDLRLKNLKKVGEPSYVGLPIQSTALDECIRVGAERIGWKEKRTRKEKGAKRRGVGAAIMMHTSGAQPFRVEYANAFIKLNEDGSASLVVHPGDAGTGSPGALAQIAAEELGVRAEDIHIITGDTDVTMFDIGSVASRTIYITGNAVLRAAQEAKGQLLARAAKTLGVPADELEVKDRRVYVKADPGKGTSVAEIAHDAVYNLKHEASSISGKGIFEPTTASPPTQAAFAEVEVDTETGEVRVLKMVIANDSGTAINPITVEGQIEGGLSMGVGWTLSEDYIIDRETGVLQTDGMQTYKIPSTLDLPEVEVILVQKPDPVGPFGAKGVGEAGMIAIAPAIANAIYHAIGVQVTELPITPEKILSALKARKTTRGPLHSGA